MGAIIDPQWPDGYWAVDPVKGGGNVLSQGVHAFDLVTYFAGADPVRIYAVGGILSHDPAVTPTVDACLATITYANGSIAQAQIGDFGPRPWMGEKSWYHVFSGRGVGPTASLIGDTLLLAYGDRGGQQFEEHTTGSSRPTVARTTAARLTWRVSSWRARARIRPPRSGPTSAPVVSPRRSPSPPSSSIRTGQPQTVAL